MSIVLTKDSVNVPLLLGLMADIISNACCRTVLDAVCVDAYVLIVR